MVTDSGFMPPGYCPSKYFREIYLTHNTCRKRILFAEQEMPTIKGRRMQQFSWEQDLKNKNQTSVTWQDQIFCLSDLASKEYIAKGH